MIVGPLNLNDNPRNGRPYFNKSLFSEQPLGTPGNVPRRFFAGPGLENWDMALLKDTRVKESISIQFRLEAFNVFNHAQFFGPTAVDGVLQSPTFGKVISAAPARSMQAAVKISF
jgi:hypothetical protein